MVLLYLLYYKSSSRASVLFLEPNDSVSTLGEIWSFILVNLLLYLLDPRTLWLVGRGSFVPELVKLV